MKYLKVPIKIDEKTVVLVYKKELHKFQTENIQDYQQSKHMYMYLKTGPKTYELFQMLNTRVFLFFFICNVLCCKDKNDWN